MPGQSLENVPKHLVMRRVTAGALCLIGSLDCLDQAQAKNSALGFLRHIRQL